MTDGPMSGRRPRAIAGMPPAALADGTRGARAWVVALVAAAPLEAVGAVPVAALAEEGPGLCAAVLRALGSDEALDDLASDTAAGATRRLAGAGAGAVAVVAALRAVLWDLVLDEAGRRDGELVAALAARLGHACDVVLATALAGPPAVAGEPPELPGDAVGEVVALRVRHGEVDPWVQAVERHAAWRRRDGRRFAVLLLEIDDADRLLAADDDGSVARAFGRVQAAVRDAVAGAEVVVEHAARLWLLVGDADGDRARALGEAAAAAAARVTQHGAPLTVSIGIAACPRDGTDAAALVVRAEEGLFAARAAGVPLA